MIVLGIVLVVLVLLVLVAVRVAAVVTIIVTVIALVVLVLVLGVGVFVVTVVLCLVAVAAVAVAAAAVAAAAATACECCCWWWLSWWVSWWLVVVVVGGAAAAAAAVVGGGGGGGGGRGGCRVPPQVDVAGFPGMEGAAAGCRVLLLCIFRGTVAHGPLCRMLECWSAGCCRGKTYLGTMPVYFVQIMFCFMHVSSQGWITFRSQSYSQWLPSTTADSVNAKQNAQYDINVWYCVDAQQTADHI